MDDWFDDDFVEEELAGASAIVTEVAPGLIHALTRERYRIQKQYEQEQDDEEIMMVLYG